MRAIGRALFWAVLLSGLGCTPDLARNSGVLAIRVVGLPREAAVVRATIGNGSSTFRVEADVPSFDGELVAESVPAGEVAVVLEATTPTAILRREATTTVAGPLTRLVVDFGGGTPSDTDGGVADDGGVDGGPTAPRQRSSNPIGHIVRDLRPAAISAGILSSSAPAATAAAYPVFIDTVTGLFGAAPAAITVSSVEVELLEATSSQVSNLQNMWRGDLTVSFVAAGSGAEVVVATGSADHDVAVLTVTATRETLAPIQAALVGGTFDVRIAGATDRDDQFSAEVRVSVVYVAYDR